MSRGCAFDHLHGSAFLLSVMTVNAGNYGIAVNQFAFGVEALSRATIYYIATLIVT